jgi:hypothetical protein
MKTCIFTLVILAAIALCIRLKGKDKAKEIFREAEDFKRAGNYRKACYYYALATYRGYNFNKCRTNILEIWNAHGPWNFKEEFEELKKEISCGYESCAEGYHEGTMTIIRNIVNKQA